MMKVDWDELEYEGNGYTFEGTLFTGIAFENAKEEYIEQSFVRGVEYGKLKVWNQEKTLIEETDMEFGTVHGTKKKWFANGRPQLETQAERGIVVAEKEWDADGNLIREFTLDSDHPNFKRLEVQRATKYPDWSDLIPKAD